ncbi:MAG: phosphatase PAP2 family protein [Bacteroidota bacterium]
MESSQSFWQYKFKDWVRDITSLGNPLILLFVPFCYFGPSKTFGILLIALAVNEVCCSLIKLFFHKKRPDGQAFKGALEKIDAGSFPSIHSSRIATAYLPMIVFADNYVTPVIVGIFILLTATSRVLLKRHFLSDVIGGLAIGTAIFLAFFFLVYP